MSTITVDKAESVVYGEREVSNGSVHSTKSAARHKAHELNRIYDETPREIATTSDESVDGFGSAKTDKKDMNRMGKEQEFRRVFRQVSLLSFTAILMATWEFVLLANTQGLVDGGRAGLLWTYVWTLVGYGFIIASLAEMASIAPTCGGQYHWVSEFAPPQYQKFLSYITGWLSALCWQAGNAAGGFLCGILVQSLIIIKDPSYTAPGWQGTLLVFPVMGACLLFNIWWSNWLPGMQNAVMIIHIFGFLAMVVILWVLSPHVPASDVFLNFENAGGWSTVGLALMIGQVTPVGALGCSDAAVHMAEEVKDAGLSVPRAMMWTFWVNGIMGLIMMVTLVFAMPNVQDALHDPTSFPFMYVLRQALPDQGVIIMTVLMMFLLMMGNISYQASTARQTFAFARDNGLPFSKWISRVDPKLMIPANAVILSTVCTLLLSLINIGSSSAFNAIISLQNVAQMGTYAISLSCVFYRRLTAPHLLPRARWSLGRWGIWINGVAIVYTWQIFFWCFWPNATPVTLKTFNWAPVVFMVTLVASLITYHIKGHKVYVGPAASVEGRRDITA
ncbi:hypothetical protein MBLNU459_g7142t1 [Dothideomycetes sp. NU459]